MAYYINPRTLTPRRVEQLQHGLQELRVMRANAITPSQYTRLGEAIKTIETALQSRSN